MRTSVRVLSGFAVALLLALVGLAQTTVQYDSKGRVVRVDYGGGTVMTFAYDAANNLVAETAAAPGNTLAVTVSPTGAGAASGTDIACPADCTETYPGTPAVALTAAPAAGWVFLGWGGALTGSLNPGSLAMTADFAVAAYFGAASGDTDGDGTPDVVEAGPGWASPSASSPSPSQAWRPAAGPLWTRSSRRRPSPPTGSTARRRTTPIRTGTSSSTTTSPGRHAHALAATRTDAGDRRSPPTACITASRGSPPSPAPGGRRRGRRSVVVDGRALAPWRPAKGADDAVVLLIAMLHGLGLLKKA